VLAVADVAQVGGDQPLAVAFRGGQGDLDGKLAALAYGDGFEALADALGLGVGAVREAWAWASRRRSGKIRSAWAGAGLCRGDAEGAFGGGVELEMPSVSVVMMQSRAASVMARLRDSLAARADWPSKRRMEVQLRASTSWRTSATRWARQGVALAGLEALGEGGGPFEAAQRRAQEVRMARVPATG
jgi:hypothetical protein